MSRARLYQFAVIACLIVFALLAARAIVPLGQYDGAD
jgi:hypothetical protein